MSRIIQFQKYSQKENAVTNNVLLMLSRLNDIKVDYYSGLIQRINESDDYSPFPIFNQQVKSNNGIMDGYVEVKASKIIIETKINSKEFINKLLKYTDMFSSDNQNNFLWHLSSQKYDKEEEKIINDELKYKKKVVFFKNLSFEDLLDNLEAIYEENKYDDI